MLIGYSHDPCLSSKGVYLMTSTMPGEKRSGDLIHRTSDMLGEERLVWGGGPFLS